MALEQLDADYDRVLGGAGELDRILAQWATTEKRLDTGWPVVRSGGWIGRPGPERTMTPAAIRLAIRSLALRPQARANLNAERRSGKRGGPHRSQVGHEHTQANRAHGAIRADELAAAEVHMSVGAVGKHRERLLALLGELEHGAPSKPTTTAPTNARNELVRDEPLTCKQCGEHLQEPSPTGLCGFCIAEDDGH